jgi:nicotinate-nucleotide pyrophosphorylase (carboxylating)
MAVKRQIGNPDPFTSPQVHRMVEQALDEDVGRGDVTSAATLAVGRRGKASLVARERAVIAGLPLARIIFDQLAGTGDPVRVKVKCPDGSKVTKGDVIAQLDGPLHHILAGERLLLNLLQTLSGTASMTAAFVAEVAGTGAVILDTRKTTPGLRLLQKYAVRCGGGRNHRFGLDDGILIKDNHIVGAGSVRLAVQRARAAASHGLRIEVECDRLAQVREAIRAGADILLLDNMSPKQVARCFGEIDGRALVEVSGGLTLETVRAYAEAGAGMLSVGALTHSAPAIDIGLDMKARKS